MFIGRLDDSITRSIGAMAAGGNAERIRNEAAFATLCGVSPKLARSGQKTGRHRLNRGGDRAANGAVYIVTIVRMRPPMSHDFTLVGLAGIEAATSALSERSIRSQAIPPDLEESQYSSSDGVTALDGETA
jgi:transposase